MPEFVCRHCRRNPVPHRRYYCEDCKHFCMLCWERPRAAGQSVCKECRRRKYNYHGVSEWSEERNRYYRARLTDADFLRTHRMRTQVGDYYRVRPEEKPKVCEFCGSDDRVAATYLGLEQGMSFWNLWLCTKHRSSITVLLGRYNVPYPANPPPLYPKPHRPRIAPTKISRKNGRGQAPQAEGQGREERQ